MSTYHCKECGKAIFKSEHIINKKLIWDLKDYQAECYLISEAIDIDSLKRYDTSLHEGWYCCKFIMMRMTHDKFGTGRNLLVYTDSVTEVKEGETIQKHNSHKGQIKLSIDDFDNVIGNGKSEVDDNTLKVVKLGAIWCPPCRLMDTVIERIDSSGDLPNVQFFEVDIDEEQELAQRWNFQSIPLTLFYKGGKQLDLSKLGYHTVEGGIVGGITEANLRRLCLSIQDEPVIEK